MRTRIALLAIVLATFLWMPAGAQPAVGPANLAPPTGARDLVVFIAKEKPELYRLVGRQPVPYGNAKFTMPIALVADPARPCFYVFDQPVRLDELRKIWRIDGQGNATVVFQGHLTTNNGPFDKPVSLGLDETGRLLVADAVTGLWRLENNGRLQQICDGKNRPLFKITAATATPTHGLIVGTSYMYEVTGGQMLNLPPDGFVSGAGNSTGRQVPISIWRNQGGLFRVKAAAGQVQAEGLVANRKPGGAEHDTCWRNLNQIFADTAGRIVLVDGGSVWKRTEEVYIRPDQRYVTDHPPTRTSTSTINGGVFLLHPDGRFEDLTFKTPESNSGPMRRPAGAAQWCDDTYIVADPELYVEGINGSGGLLLLKLDGAREARWPFGYRLKPLGVAILRGAGTPAEARAALPVRIADLAGVRTAGPITRIESVSLERKPPSTGGLLGSFSLTWDPQPTEQAEQTLRSLFEGAQWAVAPDGTLGFVARGVNPQQEGTPLVMQGKVTVQGELANASASYRNKSAFDAQIGSLDARLQRTAADKITMNTTINVFTNNERLKATFEQTMSCGQGN